MALIKAAKIIRLLIFSNTFLASNEADVANFTSPLHQTILNNATITACNNNYNQLCFLESLSIKTYIPQLYYGIN